VVGTFQIVVARHALAPIAFRAGRIAVIASVVIRLGRAIVACGIHTLVTRIALGVVGIVAREIFTQA